MSSTKLRRNRKESGEVDDPVLQMLGVGRELWEQETGDRFVERLRSEEVPRLPAQKQPEAPADLSS